MELDELPISIQNELLKIKALLEEEGVKEIYLFGSFADGSFSHDSDYDLAVVGLDKSKFFRVLGKIIKITTKEIDLVGLDYNSDFSNELRKSGTLLKVS